MSMNGMLERNTTLQVYTEMESEGRKDFTGGKITEYSKRWDVGLRTRRQPPKFCIQVTKENGSVNRRTEVRWKGQDWQEGRGEDDGKGAAICRWSVLSASTSWGWARLQPGPWNSIQVLHMASKDQSTWAFTCSLLQEAGNGSSDTGCGHPKCHLNC